MLGDYFREQLIEKIKATPNGRFAIIDQPEPGALAIELALTEVCFGHPAAYAASMASPVPGTSTAVDSTVGTSVAFEARIRDISANSVVGTAADRRTPPAKLFDLNKFTYTSSAREIASDWAAELASTLNLRKWEKINAPHFKLSPW